MEEPSIRRIAVEREVDWLKIQDNVKNGLQATLEARLALLPGGKDGPAAKGLRRELEERIKKEETFRLAKPNLRVNGHNYEDFVEATEPFDEVMDRDIKGLHAERVGWESQVVQYRRTHPAFINRVSNEVESRREGGEWLPLDDIAPDGEGGKDRDIPKPDRYQETVDTFTTVASILTELTQSASAQYARATRAQDVRKEIAEMGP